MLADAIAAAVLPEPACSLVWAYLSFLTIDWLHAAEFENRRAIKRKNKEIESALAVSKVLYPH